MDFGLVSINAPRPAQTRQGIFNRLKNGLFKQQKESTESQGNTQKTAAMIGPKHSTLNIQHSIPKGPESAHSFDVGR
jgi:hypothetical protein